MFSTILSRTFLHFVRLFAPTIVSDWQMGKHIEVISEKLKQLEAGNYKKADGFLAST